MENSLCTYWLFWFIVLGSFAALVISSFFWGWSLGARNMNFQWEQRVKALHKKWEREAQEGEVDRV
jgi:hypothetical protein